MRLWSACTRWGSWERTHTCTLSCRPESDKTRRALLAGPKGIRGSRAVMDGLRFLFVTVGDWRQRQWGNGPSEETLPLSPSSSLAHSSLPQPPPSPAQPLTFLIRHLLWFLPNLTSKGLREHQEESKQHWCCRAASRQPGPVLDQLGYGCGALCRCCRSEPPLPTVVHLAGSGRRECFSFPVPAPVHCRHPASPRPRFSLGRFWPLEKGGCH